MTHSFFSCFKWKKRNKNKIFNQFGWHGAHPKSFFILFEEKSKTWDVNLNTYVSFRRFLHILFYLFFLFFRWNIHFNRIVFLFWFLLVDQMVHQIMFTFWILFCVFFFRARWATYNNPISFHYFIIIFFSLFPFNLHDDG